MMNTLQPEDAKNQSRSNSTLAAAVPSGESILSASEPLRVSKTIATHKETLSSSLPIAASGRRVRQREVKSHPETYTAVGLPTSKPTNSAPSPTAVQLETTSSKNHQHSTILQASSYLAPKSVSGLAPAAVSSRSDSLPTRNAYSVRNWRSFKEPLNQLITSQPSQSLPSQPPSTVQQQMEPPFIKKLGKAQSEASLQPGRAKLHPSLQPSSNHKPISLQSSVQTATPTLSVQSESQSAQLEPSVKRQLEVKSVASQTAASESPQPQPTQQQQQPPSTQSLAQPATQSDQKGVQLALVGSDAEPESVQLKMNHLLSATPRHNSTPTSIPQSSAMKEHEIFRPSVSTFQLESSFALRSFDSEPLFASSLLKPRHNEDFAR